MGTCRHRHCHISSAADNFSCQLRGSFHRHAACSPKFLLNFSVMEVAALFSRSISACPALCVAMLHSLPRCLAAGPHRALFASHQQHLRAISGPLQAASMGNGLCRDGALAIDQVPGGLYNKLGSDTLLKLSTEFYTRVYDDDHLWFRWAEGDGAGGAAVAAAQNRPPHSHPSCCMKPTRQQGGASATAAWQASCCFLLPLAAVGAQPPRRGLLCCMCRDMPRPLPPAPHPAPLPHTAGAPLITPPRRTPSATSLSSSPSAWAAHPSTHSARVRGGPTPSGGCTPAGCLCPALLFSALPCFAQLPLPHLRPPCPRPAAPCVPPRPAALFRFCCGCSTLPQPKCPCAALQPLPPVLPLPLPQPTLPAPACDPPATLLAVGAGPPALMRRHATHPCTQATADRYMLHMDATLEALPEIDADSRQRLHHYFAHTCDFLVAGQAMGMGQGRGAGHSWAAAGTGTAATEVKAAQQEGGICSCNAGEAAEGQGPGQGRGQGRGRNGMGQGRGQGMGRRFGWGGAGAGAKGQQEGSTTASPEAPPVAPGKGSHTGRGRGWGRNGGGGLGQGRRACTGDGPCMGDMTLAGA